MNINKTDFIWNFFATIFKISSSAILIPYILIKLPTQDVAIYTILITISSVIYILDFGFNPSFTRNVTYAYSGVSELKAVGLSETTPSGKVNNILLSDLILAMRWFYKKLAIIVAVILIFGVSIYFYFVTESYPFLKTEIWITYFIFVLSSVYNLYTVYYESLLVGSGNIKYSKKILIIGQSVYIILSLLFIYLFNSLIGIFISQLISIFLVRYLSKLIFFKINRNVSLDKLKETSKTKEFIKKVILPNAKKIGLTSLGGAIITKASFIIGSLYLTLDEIASYGITFQILSIISVVSVVYLNTFLPKISELRIKKNKIKILKITNKGLIYLVLIYILSTLVIVCYGSEILILLGSNTLLIHPNKLLLLLIFNFFIESIILFSGNVLLTKNYVPFYKASIISGLALVFLLIFLLNSFSLKLEIMIITPIIINLSYQGWKWLLEVYKDLKHD
jgi:O-antigen/teichoic acid export membrane protein